MRRGEAGNPADWERLELLYSKVSGLPAADRHAFLDTECADNPALRAELEALLDCTPAASAFFDRFHSAVHTAFADPAPLADPLVGTTLGHYRIEGRLGAGGMGIVYRAYDLHLQRTVALKLLASHLREDSQARIRFLTEARAAAALDHPNICTIHETGEADGGVPYIAMAFCQGESLRSTIARGRLASSAAVRIALQMARALAAAHARGIIHRDVKPGNVMIGPDGLVKLVDFGLARLGDAVATTTAAARGTFAYMAPELLRGARADAATDLWSLGVLLYEMLSGLRPFRADSDAALLYAIVNERPEPIEVVQPDVPQALRQIVARLLHEDAAVRYRDAQEVASDLAALLEPEQQTTPMGTRRVEPRPQPQQAGSRRRFAARLGAVAVLSIVGLVTLLTVLAPDDPGSSKASGALPRVAVLFFHDDTPGQNGSAVVNRLNSGLVEALMAVPALDVPSSQAMQPYRGRTLPVSTIANELGAGWLVGGILERSMDGLVVRAELSDSTGRIIDSRTIAGVPDSVLVQHTVEEVAIMLRERIGEVMRERRWQAGTSSEAALALVRQAFRDKETAESLVERTQPLAAIPQLYRADSALARAAQADASWPEPWIERGWIARTLGAAMFGLVSQDSGIAALDRGVEYANKALELGRDSARALEIRGVLRRAKSVLSPADSGLRSALTSDAEKDLDEAIRSNPALARALDVMSEIQFARGEFEHAGLTTEQAYRADYYAEESVILKRLFDTAFETSQDSLARQRCALIARRLPTDWYGAYCRLALLTWSADAPSPDSARQLVQRMIAVTAPANRSQIEAQLSVLAVGVLARTVSADSAERVLIRTLTRALNEGPLSSNDRQVLLRLEASVRVRLGDRDGAVQLIRQFLEAVPDSRARYSNSRIFKTLFSDPRLRAPVAPH